MTLLETIRDFVLSKREPVHIRDLYSNLPDRLPHSIRARIYENLGKHFRRVGRGLYVAMEGEAVCIVAQGDAWEELKKLPTGVAHALVTDPPYGWLDHFVRQGTTRRRLKWDFERRDIDLELGRELYRILQDGAHAFFFVPALTGATEPHFRRLIDTLRKCGLHFQKLWIWEKDVNGMGYSGRARHEGIAFFSKGQKRQPFDLSLPDVLSFPIVPPPQRCHPAEKPVALLKAIIQFATKAGELVLDCFAGSCATGRAALSLGRDSIMIEKSEEVLTRAVAS